MSKEIHDIDLKQLIESETGKSFNRDNKICCPFHNENTPSFSLKKDNSKWKCFGCGRGGDAIDFIKELRGIKYTEGCKYLGIGLNEEYKRIATEEEEIQSYIKWQIDKIDKFKGYELIKIYRFCDQENKTLYFKAKFKKPDGKKDQSYYHIKDGKVINRRGHEEVPYNYYKLSKAIKERKHIFIVEGEKDADTLAYFGYKATSLKGVKKFGKLFKGTIVNFIGDTGKAGKEYLDHIYYELSDYIKLFNVIEPTKLDDLGDNADITDWFEAGHTLEEFKELVSKSYNDSKSRKPSFINKKDKVVPSILAEIVARDIVYKQYMKSDYIYNGYYYEKINDTECLQKEIKNYIPLEIQTTRTINETMNLLRIDNTISSSIENEFISVNNGLINIRTQEIKAHTPDVFSLFKISCDYAGINSTDKFNNSRFNQYLCSTFNNDKNTISLVGEILGASLLPNPKLFKKIIFLLGDGSNGKSVFINIIQALHGNIFSTVPLKDIDSNRFALAGMVGKKINVDADASGTRLEETSNLKKIATGDNVSIEEKGKQAINGALNILMIVGLNKMPSTADKSYGFIRRNTILPFKQTFVNSSDIEAINKGALPIDINLESDIINKEMDIVLSFALDGLNRLLKNNYNTTRSEEVEIATKEYQLENDSVMAFYESNKDGEHIQDYSANTIYTIYENWCNNNLCVPVSKTSFGTRFKKYYEKGRNSSGAFYKNVRLNK